MAVALVCYRSLPRLSACAGVPAVVPLAMFDIKPSVIMSSGTATLTPSGPLSPLYSNLSGGAYTPHAMEEVACVLTRPCRSAS